MFKVIFLLKRKAGVTHEAFRRHYENSHSRLAQKHLGHLMTRYVRNYPTQVLGGRTAVRGPIEWEYDVVTEWEVPDEDALNQIYLLFKDPVIGKEFYDDEEPFLDREAVVMIKCQADDVMDTGVRPVGGAS